MAKLVDPDQLNQETEVIIVEGAKTIQLLIAGNLSDSAPGRDSGVTGKCLYSFLKEEWQSDADLNMFRFPIKMIYEASFQLINGWAFADQQSMDLIRDAGFQDIANTDEYACVITLGNMDDSAVDQAYFDQIAGADDNTTVAPFHLTGEVNENILTDDGTNDYTGYLKVFLREEQKLFAEYNLLDEQGLSSLKYEAYRLPVSNGADLKCVDNDTVISGGTGSITGVDYTTLGIDYITGAKYVTGASIISDNAGDVVIGDVIQDAASPGRWYRCTGAGDIDATDNSDLSSMGGTGTATFEVYPGERQIGSNFYAFNRIVDCQDGSSQSANKQEIHSWLQYQLRQNVDINDDTNGDSFGTVYGKIAPGFTSFVGDQMWGEPGVYFDDSHADDNNAITYQDIGVGAYTAGGVEGVDYGLDSEFLPSLSNSLNNPFYASFSLVFSANLVAETEADTLFKVYFTNDDAGDDSGADFDTAAAIIVKDKDLTDITDTITTTTYTFQYDYSGNVQRGTGSDDTPVPITVVFQGLEDSEWNESSFTIQKSTGQSFACNTNDELNYSNPT